MKTLKTAVKNAAEVEYAGAPMVSIVAKSAIGAQKKNAM